MYHPAPQLHTEPASPLQEHVKPPISILTLQTPPNTIQPPKWGPIPWCPGPSAQLRHPLRAGPPTGGAGHPPSPSHTPSSARTSFIYLFAEPLTCLKGAFVRADNQWYKWKWIRVWGESGVCVCGMGGLGRRPTEGTAGSVAHPVRMAQQAVCPPGVAAACEQTAAQPSLDEHCE